jgi:two-component system sensor histidine kinase/response regulator
LRILFADDQEDIRALTTYQLERNGHQVVSAADGAAALQAFQRGPFDIVLLDEEMPGMSGIQTVHAIREHAKSQRTDPLLVALTGNNTPDDCRRLLAAGFDAVIGKPFHMDTLKALFSESPSQPFSPVLKPHVPVVSSTPGNMTPLERLGGDEKLLRKMIHTFLRDNPKRMTALKHALTRKDSSTLASHAHALQGPVGLFADDKARVLAHDLQNAAHQQDFLAANRCYSSLKEEIAKLEANLRRYAKQPKVKSRTKGTKSG